VAVALSTFTRVLTAGVVPLAVLLALGLELLSQLSQMVGEMYFFPRAKLDGVPACASGGVTLLTGLIDKFMQDVARVSRRPDCVVLAAALDAPNVHRVREVREVLASSMGHVRHFWELWVKGIHQPAKKAIKQSNGWEDAARAVERMCESELISRLALDPAHFGVPAHWLLHTGARLALASSLQLWSGTARGWSVHGGVINAAVAPEAARSLARFFVPAGFHTAWYSRASRGRGDILYVGGAVAVLVRGADRGRCVDVADDRQDNESVSAFYRVAAIFKGRQDVPCAVVQPFQRAPHGGGYMLLSTRLLFLKLHVNVRRAVVMHQCDSECVISMAGVVHGARNS